jgi:hypothetical protein
MSLRDLFERAAARVRADREAAWKAVGVAMTLGLFLAVLSALYLPGDLLFPNSDFENGNLLNWRPEEKAFLFQPTFGDNSYYRNRGSSHLVGNYYVGSYERRPSAYHPKGTAQGDEPTGRLVSVTFRIRRNRISFLIGGGDDTAHEAVTLEVEGQPVLTERGRAIYVNGERMNRVTWDVSRWKGAVARIVIEDSSAGPWGHVSADDFRYR